AFPVGFGFGPAEVVPVRAGVVGGPALSAEGVGEVLGDAVDDPADRAAPDLEPDRVPVGVGAAVGVRHSEDGHRLLLRRMRWAPTAPTVSPVMMMSAQVRRTAVVHASRGVG